MDDANPVHHQPRKPMALAYEIDQWSPINLDGFKHYSHQQLMLLRMQPSSQTIPKCKPKLGALARVDLMPPFAKKCGMHLHETPPPQPRRNLNQQHQTPQNHQQHNKHHHHQQSSNSAQQSQHNQHNHFNKPHQQANAESGPGNNKKTNQRNHNASQKSGYKNKPAAREQRGFFLNGVIYTCQNNVNYIF